MIRVFLVDDHELVRDGLKALLTGIPDIQITGEASSGQELFSKIITEQPDILVLDISLPDMSGIEITRRITKEYPVIKVLILSMYTHEDFVLNAIKAGAKGYLPKNTSRNELVEAIYTLDRNEEFFGQTISRVLVKSYVRQTKDKQSLPEKTALQLSDRETGILRMSVEGYSNKEICNKLNISIRTVETHKNHIMKKLGLKSTVELVRFAIKNGMIEI
ncbi:MAG: response regulator transcription factor [Bacteroidota bacterium]|nr:response regulator transcription factor [Bacteroidota bacterium]